MTNKLVLQTITIKNNFFISNLEKIPKYRVCFYPNKNYNMHPHLKYYLDNKSFYDNIIEIPKNSKKNRNKNRY